jgi:hypothetical protein
MNKIGSPERVYVENDWYDGPRSGVADINGIPHRFRSNFDEQLDEYLGTFLVWPIDDQALALEIEQWQIFIAWNTTYEAGEATTESHPGHGGISARWDELERLLKQSRTEVPAAALQATAEMHDVEGSVRYASSGPGYLLNWRML